MADDGKMPEEQKRILQAMTPAQKLKAAEMLYFSARELKAAWLRSLHPQWTEAAIEQAVRDAFLYARD